MMTDSLFDIRCLRHHYQGETVLEHDQLSIRPETITGLTGPNGSGKSTFLNILGLIVKPSQGSINFMGSPVAPFSNQARHRIALLPQDPYLLKRSVFDNVAYGLFIRKKTIDLERRVFDALDTVGLASKQFAHRHVHHLSGGEARRVALAARLVLNPDVLLLDEPTSHVDEQSRRMIHSAVLAARKNRKTTLVISSHDREWLYSISDRVLTFLKGRIHDQGRLNILYGPWKKWANNLYHGPIQDDSKPFPVLCPPHEQAIGILPARSLGLSGSIETLPEGSLSCRCFITGWAYESSTETMFVSMKNGETTLVSAFEKNAHPHITPGEAVHVFYFPRDLTFY